MESWWGTSLRRGCYRGLLVVVDRFNPVHEIAGKQGVVAAVALDGDHFRSDIGVFVVNRNNRADLQLCDAMASAGSKPQGCCVLGQTVMLDRSHGTSRNCDRPNLAPLHAFEQGFTVSNERCRSFQSDGRKHA